jgi:hypothetical protein
MSYKVPVSANRAQLERQQEKLRIAREVLARAEAKYARKRHVKHPMGLPAKMGASATLARQKMILAIYCRLAFRGRHSGSIRLRDAVADRRQ